MPACSLHVPPRSTCAGSQSHRQRYQPLPAICIGLFRSCAQQGAALGPGQASQPGGGPQSQSVGHADVAKLSPSVPPDGHAKPSLPAAPLTETETEAPSALPQHHVEGTQDMSFNLDIKKGKSVPVCRLRERPRDGKGGGGGATAPSEPAPPMSTMMILEGVGSSNSVACVCWPTALHVAH
jgi:hypothetical protein